MDFFSGTVYAIFLIIACVLAYQAERFNYNKVLVFVTYVFVAGFWAIRYKIGWDYGGYMSIFDMVKSDTIIFSDPAYNFLNSLFVFSPYGYVYVIAITTILLYFFLFKFLVRERILFYGLFFSLAYQLQFMASNQMRQAFVIIVFLYALTFIEKRQYWRYIILILIMATVHMTAIFMLVAPLLAKIRLPKWFIFSSIIGAFGLLLLGVFKSFGTYVLMAMPFYNQYKFMESRMMAEDTGFSIVMFFWIAVSLYLTLYRDRINRPTFFNVYIAGVIGYVIFFDFHLINRMMQYFVMINIPLSAFLCKDHFRQGVSLFAVSFLAYVMLSYKTPHLHGVHPYNNIFMEYKLKQI